ncbi:MAG: hypothetical protein EOP81_11035 [Variovorax sp.]|nr:MAG: hypothetical protein EOP81_11035 [Variovorax sp.]
MRLSVFRARVVTVNKSYRSIWNESLGAWVAASEISRARGKRSGRAVLTAAASVLLAAGWSAGAHAATYEDPTTGAICNATGTPAAGAIGAWTCQVPNANGGYSILTRVDAGPAGTPTAVTLATLAGPTTIGADAVAIGTSGVDYTRATGTSAVAVGTKAWAVGESAVAMGDRARATGKASVALGYKAEATGEYAAALGAGAQAFGDSAYAMGNNALARQFDVAIGGAAMTGSTGSTQTTALGYQAGAASTNAVESTFVGVAAGAQSSGTSNAFVGSRAGAQSAGNLNVANGAFALAGVQGNANVAQGNGAGALVTGDRNVAIGRLAGSKVTVDAAGNPAVLTGATYSDAVNIGSQTQAFANNAVAVGTSAKARKASTIAIGQDADAAQGIGTVAIGNGARTANQWTSNEPGASVVIGKNAASTSLIGSNVAIGNGAQTGISGGVAVGVGAKVTSVYGDLSVAGTTGGTYYFGGVAVGVGANAYSDGSTQGAGSYTPVAIGNGAKALSDGAVAIAEGANATNTAAVAIGIQTKATGGSAIALGRGAQATGEKSISIGTGNIVNGARSGAIGDPSVIDGADSYSVGNSNTLSAAAANTFVLGNNVNIDVANATALGNATDVTVAGGVALGSEAIANRAAGVVGYDVSTGTTAAAGTAIANTVGTLGAVSVGAAGKYRQITNVAAGSADTDAVNVAQLKAVRAAAVAGETHYFSVQSNNPTDGNYDNKGATGADAIAIGKAATATNINGIAIGNQATSANNEAIAIGFKSQATGQSGTALGYQSNAFGSSSLSLGYESAANNNGTALGTAAKALGVRSTALGTDSKALGTSSAALGDQAKANANNTVALGYLAQANEVGSVALGSNSITAAANATPSVTVDGKTYNFAGTAPASVVSVGSVGSERQITNVAAGRISGTSTDAINGSQLYATNQAVDTLGDQAVRYTVNPDGTVNYNSVTLNPGGAGPTTITNVAAGVNPNDAVNVSQLTNVSNVANKGWNVAANGEATGGNVAPGGTVDFSSSDNNIAITRTGSNLSLALAKDVVLNAGGSLTVGNTTMNNGGITIVGSGAPGTTTVSLTNTGLNNGGNTITNVAAGVNATDGVNVSQLTTAVSGASNKWITGSQTTTYGAPSATGPESTAVGSKSSASGANSTAVGTGAVASVGNSVALGNNSTTTAATPTASATIRGTTYNFAGANPAGVVSVGSAGAERQIQSVAAGQLGATSTDAVNGSQLYATNLALESISAVAGAGINVTTAATGTGIAIGTSVANVGPGGTATYTAGNNMVLTQNGANTTFAVNDNPNFNSVTVGGTSITQNGINAGGNVVSNVAPGVAGTDAVNVNQLNSASAANNAYTDARVNGLGNEMRGIAKNAYAGVAAAMAVQMPGSYVPGKTVMRIGGAVFKGESAVGVSFRRTAENNGWSLTGGVGLSRAGAAVTAGVEWVFN